MKKIINLAKILYKINKNSSSKISGKTKVLLYIGLAVYMFFIFANFWGLFIEPLNEIGSSESAIKLMLALGSIFVFTTSIVYVVNVLYFTNDLESILPLPFKPKEIFIAKILNIYLYDLLIVTMILLPGFITYAIRTGAGLLFGIYSLIVLLLVPVIPILVIVALSTLLMQFIKFTKYKNFFRIASTILLVTIIMFFEFNINSNMSDSGEYSGEYLLELSANIEQSMPHYIKMVSNIFYNLGEISGLISLVCFILINVVLTYIVVSTFEKLYWRSIFHNSDGNFVKHNKKNYENYKENSKYISILFKDLKNLFRDVTYFMQCVIPIFLVPVIITIFTITSSNDAGEIFPLEFISAKFLTSICILQFFMMMNHVSITAISRDGKKEIMYLKSFPLNFEKIVNAKVVPGILLGTASILFGVITSNILLQLNIFENVCLIVVGILLNIVKAYLDIMIDLKNPKLEWESEIAVVKQNMNIFYSMIIWFGVIIIEAIIGGLLINMNVLYLTVLNIVLLSLTYAILRKYVKKNANKLFLNMG